jgi:hypothetical protein
MALGNFIASFIADAFMGLPEDRGSLALQTIEDGAVVRWSMR